MGLVRSLGLAFVATLALGEAAAADPAPAASPATLSAAGEGRRVFVKLNCYGCHGPFARGGISISLVGFGPSVGFFVEYGVSYYGMPSFAKYVSDTDKSNLSAYLESLGTSSEPTFFDWWLANPTK